MKERLILHETTVHEREKEKPFKCDLCQKRFGDNCHLNTHQRTVHEKKKPFKCNICQTSFGHILNSHQRIVHEN